MLNSTENIAKALSSHPIVLWQEWENYQKNQENFDATTSPPSSDDEGVMGLSFGVFLMILLLVFVPFILAIYYLIKNRAVMPTWAFVLGWVLLFSGFALFALLLALFAKKEEPVAATTVPVVPVQVPAVSVIPEVQGQQQADKTRRLKSRR